MHDQSLHQKKIGQLLLREGVIDENQLEQALTMQAQRATYRPLGGILEKLGFVSRRTLYDVLLKYRKQILLGELLVKIGVISDEQLAEALKLQRYNREKLGQILVERGFVTRSGLVDALCAQLGISGIDLGVGLPDKELLSKVNPAFLRSKRIMPLRYDNDKRALIVLTEDPTDKETITDLEKMFNMDVEPVMLHNSTVDYLLDGFLDIWNGAR